MMVIATLGLGARLVVYDAILGRIATPDERDAVSRGWAFGYLGGGLLLALNLVLVTVTDLVGIETGMAARISLLSAGLWWAVFTLIPVIGLWTCAATAPAVESPERGGAGQPAPSSATPSATSGFPQTMLFLLAYLFFNDGIQTVIDTRAASTGPRSCGSTSSQLHRADPARAVRGVRRRAAVRPGRRRGSAPGGPSCAAWSLWTLIVVVAASSCPPRAWCCSSRSPCSSAWSSAAARR